MACPVCGGGNAATLSAKAADSGAVLIKCFKSGCDAEQIAAALRLQVADLFPPRPDAGGGASPQARRRLLPASQALELAADEVRLVALVACDIANGQPVTDETRERCLTAAARILALDLEARS
jgi:hypothetical protein